MRLSVLVRLWAVAALASSPAAADAGPPVAVVDGLGVLGVLTASGEDTARRPGVVVFDETGALPERSLRYGFQLEAAGFAVLLSHDDPEQAAADEADAAVRLRRAIIALAARPEVDPGRIAILAFGAGNQAALHEAAEPATASAGALVLLYPGCPELETLPAPEVPVLLLHGADDPANPAGVCTRLAAAWRRAGADVRHHVYAGASFGWDIPQAFVGQASWEPAPSGRGRIRARYWPDLAEFSAAVATGFLAVRLGGPGLR